MNPIFAPPPVRLLLAPPDAARALAISPRSLWTLMKSGEIPHVKVGRSVRYAVTDLEAWIAKQRIGGLGRESKSTPVDL